MRSPKISNSSNGHLSRALASVFVALMPFGAFGQTRTFILVVLRHSQVDLLVCFGLLSCYISQVCLSLSLSTTRHQWAGFFGRQIHDSINDIRPSNSWSSKTAPSHYHHYFWLLTWCSFYEVWDKLLIKKILSANSLWLCLTRALWHSDVTI